MITFSNFSNYYALSPSSFKTPSFLLIVYGSEGIVQASRETGISETNILIVGIVGETFIAFHPKNNY
jgi:hypothetical protein